jgi:hypothetical protein
MNIPRLEIYLDEGNNICLSRVEKKDGASRLIVNMPIQEANELEEDELSYRIGKSILNILSFWHKDIFVKQKKDSFVPSETVEQSVQLYETALRLIGIALDSKTKTHNVSIEDLLQQSSIHNLDARFYLENTWPTLLRRLESYT